LAFINPLIEAAFEYTGFADDGRLTDPTHLSGMARMATNIYNLAVSRGLIPGDIAFSDPMAGWNQAWREHLSSWVSKVTPDWLPLQETRLAENTGGVNHDKFFNIMIASAMEDGMTLDEATTAATEANLEGKGALPIWRMRGKATNSTTKPKTPTPTLRSPNRALASWVRLAHQPALASVTRQ
jgi:hypothetical protein